MNINIGKQTTLLAICEENFQSAYRIHSPAQGDWSVYAYFNDRL